MNMHTHEASLVCPHEPGLPRVNAWIRAQHTPGTDGATVGTRPGQGWPSWPSIPFELAVDRPESYPWSSYRATVGYEPAPSWLTTDCALAPFERDLNMQQSGYRQFIDGGAGISRSPL